MSDLIRGVHDALNATAIPRRPDPDLLPPAANHTWLRLPHPCTPTGALAAALAGRRSRYAFGSQQPSLDALAALLLLGVATAPRAGGLPSVTPYVITRGRGEVPAGVHRADLRYPLPALHQVRDGDPTRFIEASLEQPQFAGRVPLWVGFVIDLGVGVGRYPDRHYRTLHLDAGVAMQNLLLVATALGLSTCPVMGYDDTSWSELLDLPETGIVAGIVAIG